MNTPKALELAMNKIIRQHCELGSNVLLRPWQSLAQDGAFDPDDDRSFPCVDIRFSAPRYNEDQVTLVCVGLITAYTKAEDDKDHAAVSELFEAVYAEALAIFRDSCGATNTGRFDELKQYTAECGDTLSNIGGITLEDGFPPDDENGLNAIGVAIGVHFSYA